MHLRPHLLLQACETVLVYFALATTRNNNHTTSRHMILMAMAGIENLLRSGVHKAVASCCLAGITVKTCVGEGPCQGCALIARSIATLCGIDTPGGLIKKNSGFPCPRSTRASQVPAPHSLGQVFCSTVLLSVPPALPFY